MTVPPQHGTVAREMTKAKGEKFEALLEKLEKIVQRLEEGDLPLDESLSSFEEGMSIAKLCETRLNEAQKKIEILMKARDGSAKKTPTDFEVEE